MTDNLIIYLAILGAACFACYTIGLGHGLQKGMDKRLEAYFQGIKEVIDFLNRYCTMMPDAPLSQATADAERGFREAIRELKH